MSTDIHKSGHGNSSLPVHEDVTFEPRDLNPAQIVKYLIYLAICVAISFGICVFVLDFTTKLAVDNDKPLPPIWETLTPQQREQATYPPEPRLQGIAGHDTDGQEDMREMRKAGQEANDRLGWIDQKQGIAQIPVDDAMKIIAEKGFAGGQSGSEAKH